MIRFGDISIHFGTWPLGNFEIYMNVTGFLRSLFLRFTLFLKYNETNYSIVQAIFSSLDEGLNRFWGLSTASSLSTIPILSPVPSSPFPLPYPARVVFFHFSLIINEVKDNL